MSEVISYAQAVDAWMKAGGREQVAARLKRRRNQRVSAEACRRLRQSHGQEVRMYKQGVGDFKYYVGHQLARAGRDARRSRLRAQHPRRRIERRDAGRSRVFGRQRRVRHLAGRRGQVLETPIGNVPVYNNVLEGLNDGHRFNCGVIYLPPSAARDGVAELIRVNPELKKIFIVTEKLVRARLARDPRHGPAERHRHLRRQQPRRRRCLEPGAHRRRARRRQSRRRRCARARSRSSPIPATSRPRSRPTCAWPAGARRR